MSQRPYTRRGGRLRCVGVDDGAFLPAWRAPQGRKKALLAAALLEDLSLSAVRLGWIQVDGMDSTRVLIGLLKGLNIDMIMLSGVTFAGFNIVDAKALYKALKKPVLIISGKKPQNKSVRLALKKHFSDWKERWRIIASLGRINSFAPKPSEPPLYFEAIGIAPKRAKEAIKMLSSISRFPEPIRVASLIAKGLTSGQAIR